MTYIIYRFSNFPLRWKACPAKSLYFLPLLYTLVELLKSQNSDLSLPLLPQGVQSLFEAMTLVKLSEISLFCPFFFFFCEIFFTSSLNSGAHLDMHSCLFCWVFVESNWVLFNRFFFDSCVSDWLIRKDSKRGQ